MRQTIDCCWSDDGYSARPWVPADHGADRVIDDLDVIRVANGKAIYCPVHSPADYLLGKRSDGAAIDPTAHPLGYQYRSLTVRRVAINGVKRVVIPDVLEDAHCDGFYTVASPHERVTARFERVAQRNTDASVQSFLFQPGCIPGPTREEDQDVGLWELIEFLACTLEPTCVRQRVNFKPGGRIDLARFERFLGHPTIIPPYGSGGYLTKVELVNSPDVDTSLIDERVTEVVRRNPTTVCMGGSGAAGVNHGQAAHQKVLVEREAVADVLPPGFGGGGQSQREAGAKAKGPKAQARPVKAAPKAKATKKAKPAKGKP